MTPRTSFVGREPQLQQVNHLLSTTRLLTLTGAGGCGKTRLALRAATDLERDRADGIALVELAAVPRGSPVVQAAAAALGVREAPDRRTEDVISDHVGQTSLLLVLDNCEHVVEPTAQLVDELLNRCPQLQLLHGVMLRRIVQRETPSGGTPLGRGTPRKRHPSEEAPLERENASQHDTLHPPAARLSSTVKRHTFLR